MVIPDRKSSATPLSVILWISEQIASIYLYSINCLVFIPERRRVYCAVRTESLNAIQVNLSIGRVVFQTVGRRTVTTDARFKSQVNSFEICG